MVAPPTPETPQMQLARDAEVFERGEAFILWSRDLDNGHKLMGVELFGIGNDARSKHWRDAVDRFVKACGRPTLSVMDVRHHEVQTSLATRVSTALWARGFLRGVQRAYVVTGAAPRRVLATRAILRVVGVAHILVIDDEEHIDFS